MSKEEIENLLDIYEQYGRDAVIKRYAGTYTVATVETDDIYMRGYTPFSEKTVQRIADDMSDSYFNHDEWSNDLNNAIYYLKLRSFREDDETSTENIFAKGGDIEFDKDYIPNNNTAIHKEEKSKDGFRLAI